MSNVVFIHAANMLKDVSGYPCDGLCQQIIHRLEDFILDSKMYEVVDSFHLGYIGEKGLTFNIPKSVITYHNDDIYTWEFPTLQHLRKHCKENPNDNVCYLHTQGVSQGFYHHELQRINERRDYHFYWNVTQHKDSIEYLKWFDTCGAMLVPLNADIIQEIDGTPRIKRVHNNAIWHYSQNFWWARAKHINSLPDPENYPMILDKRHQAEFWLCSSTGIGNFRCIHSLYDTWCYATNFDPIKYMDKETLLKLKSFRKIQPPI